MTSLEDQDGNAQLLRCVQCLELLTEAEVHDHYVDNHQSYYIMPHDDVAVLVEPVDPVEVPIRQTVKVEKREIHRSGSLSTEECDNEDANEIDLEQFIKVELCEDVKPLIALKLNLLPPGMVTTILKSKTGEDFKSTAQNPEIDALYFKKGKEGFESEVPLCFGTSQIVEFYCFLKSYAQGLKPGERHHIFNFMSELLYSPQTPERDTNLCDAPIVNPSATSTVTTSSSSHFLNQDEPVTVQGNNPNVATFNCGAQTSSAPPPVLLANTSAPDLYVLQINEVPQPVPPFQPQFLHTVGGRLSASHFMQPPNVAQDTPHPIPPPSVNVPPPGTQAPPTHPIPSNDTASIPQIQANQNPVHPLGSANIPPVNAIMLDPMAPVVNTNQPLPTQNFYTQGTGTIDVKQSFWNNGDTGGGQHMPNPESLASIQVTNHPIQPGLGSAETFSEFQYAFMHDAPATFTNANGNNMFNGPVAEDIKPFPLPGVIVEGESEVRPCFIKCELCFPIKKFPTKAALLEHQWEVHKTDVNKFCEYCDKCGTKYQTPGGRAWIKHQEKCKGPEVVFYSSPQDIQGHKERLKQRRRENPYARRQ